MLNLIRHVIATPNGRVLQDPFDYRLPAEGRLGITGPSGSGKSTLLRQIAEASASRGTTSIKLANEKFDYVPQTDFLFPWYSPRQNYVALLNPASRRIEPEHVQLARDLGLESALDRDYSHLSGGERQRAALWTALCGAPAFLAIDEPFTALDIERKLVCMAALAASLTRTSATCILVSHDFEILTYLCDTVLIFPVGPGKITREMRINDARLDSRDAYLKRRRSGAYEELLAALTGAQN